jgi:hypothetical protein
MNAKYLKIGVVLAGLVALSVALYAVAGAALGGEDAGQSTEGWQVVQVDQVDVEFGQGSPFPVHAAVALSLPGQGSQISQITQRLEGPEFIITVLAVSPGSDGAMIDTLPYRMWLPLNMAGLPADTYTVTVNGVSTSFQFPPPAGG